MVGIALRADAAARKRISGKSCDRFPPGPVSADRMERLYRESIALAAILSRNAASDALVLSKASFHIELAAARARRKTRDDFAFVTRLRWAEQWIEIGLLYVGADDDTPFVRALGMIDEAREIFTGESSPGCAPPKTALPPLARDADGVTEKRGR